MEPNDPPSQAFSDTARPLVLASASPRRRELLAGIGLHPEVRPADIDESVGPGETAEGYVGRLAGEKAQAVSRPGELVLAADTVVVLDGDLLGKPRDAADAASMLRRLAGRGHTVATGVAVHDVDAGRLDVQVVATAVRFAPLTEAEVSWYVASGEPMDKAGSYAIQGLGALFVEAIEGSYSNVVGLPLATTYRMLVAAGYPLLGRADL